MKCKRQRPSVVIAGVRFRSGGPRPHDAAIWRSECGRWELFHAMHGRMDAQWEIHEIEPDGLPGALVHYAIDFGSILRHAKQGWFTLKGKIDDAQ